jgi:hypothetical protein
MATAPLVDSRSRFDPAAPRGRSVAVRVETDGSLIAINKRLIRRVHLIDAPEERAGGAS